MLSLVALFCSMLPVIALAALVPGPAWFKLPLRITSIVALLLFMFRAFGIVRGLLFRAVLEARVVDGAIRLHTWIQSVEVPWDDIRGLALFPSRRLRVSLHCPTPTPFQIRFFGGRLRWVIGGPSLALVVARPNHRARYWIIPHPLFVPEIRPTVEWIEAQVSNPDV
jgi:hypothetical protein